MTAEYSSLTVLLEHGVGRPWAEANLGGVLCGSSKKSYNPLPKKESHNYETRSGPQQGEVSSPAAVMGNSCSEAQAGPQGPQLAYQ